MRFWAIPDASVSASDSGARIVASPAIPCNVDNNQLCGRRWLHCTVGCSEDFVLTGLRSYWKWS
ncbi:hypothetical protein Bca4012_083955 [Brassica carinata]